MDLLSDPIFAHPATRACLSDQALIAAMIRVEAALARAQEGVGMVPAGTAQAIEAVEITGETLRAGVSASGVPIPALLAEMRAALPPEVADWLHYGATSQDIVDTAVALCFRDALNGLGASLTAVVNALIARARAHPGLPMVARTRGQYATPISFALRVANWCAPLIALEHELPALRRGALRVQLGGSAGSSYAIHPHGPEIATAMARDLGLSEAVPWHVDRSGFAKIAHWLVAVVSALTKMARDLAIAARSEVGEMRAGAGGGSSTMPHKSNPVTTEALMACHPVAMGALAGLTAAAAHTEERDGAAWSVEWLLYPQLAEVTGAALAHAQHLADTLEPLPDAMEAAITENPAVMAEALVFALAPTLGRDAATKQVKEALAKGMLPGGEVPDAHDLARIADLAAERIFKGRD